MHWPVAHWIRGLSRLFIGFLDDSRDLAQNGANARIATVVAEESPHAHFVVVAIGIIDRRCHQSVVLALLWPHFRRQSIVES
jgi:hypothetical protein